MSKQRLTLGRSGEEIAQAYLLKSGYKILSRNYKSRLGEIDIIAQDKDTLCFIEVKTRCSHQYGLPQEAINRAKQRHISRVALSFLKENNLLEQKARFDVVSVSYAAGFPEVHLIKHAFELGEAPTY